jgi:hypothetical protein
VQADVAELQAGQQGLIEGQQSLTTHLSAAQHLQDTLVTMQADYRDIYDRVREIERQR